MLLPIVTKIVGDHPRIRGEHLTKADAITADSGSSPHTRGALGDYAKRAPAGRIIPAYAGSTPIRDPAPSTWKDHPRIRGEHEVELAGEDHPDRIIPAYAGSTGRGAWWSPG